MRGWMDAATLTRMLNLQGRFLARAAEGLPFLLEEGMACALVPPVSDAPRRVTVASVEAAHGKHEGDHYVTFVDLDDPAIVELLVGCHCLVRESDVEGSLDPRASADDGEGLPSAGTVRLLAARSAMAKGVHALDEHPWTVIDEKAGPIGTLSRIEERPVQSLLVVERTGANGAASEVLIPLVEELIDAVDESARTVNVRVPSGLLDL